MMSLPSRTPVTDGGGIVRRVPNRAISPLLVPAIIAQITGTSALILIAISASGLVLTNVMATTATGNDAFGLRCVAVSEFSGQRADMLNFIRNVCFDPKWTFGEAKPLSALTGHRAGASERPLLTRSGNPFLRRPGLLTNAPPVALLRQWERPRAVKLRLGFRSLLRGQGDGRWRALRKLRPHSF